MIRVFTDTAANLPPEVLEKYHIRTLPLTYRVDGELPEGEFDGPAYYDAIRGGAEVKTAMVNPQDTAEGWSRCWPQGMTCCISAFPAASAVPAGAWVSRRTS